MLKIYRSREYTLDDMHFFYSIYIIDKLKIIRMSGSSKSSFKSANSFQEAVDENMNAEFVQSWLKHPLVNMLYQSNEIDIDVDHESEYGILYHSCFEFLTNQGLDDDEILELMPKHHILYEKLDFLYLYHKYKRNADDGCFIKIYDNLMNVSLNSTKKMEFNEMNMTRKLIHAMYRSYFDLHKIFYETIMIQEGIFLSIKELTHFQDDFHENVKDMKYLYSNLLPSEIASNFDNSFVMIHDNDIHIDDDEKYLKLDIEFNSSPDAIISNRRFFQFHKTYFTSIVNLIQLMIKVKTDRNPKKSIQYDLLMTDPLQQILNNNKFKDIDLQNLFLPEQTYTDQEFNELKSLQTKLKEKYTTSLQSYKDGSAKTSPKPETMKLNGKKVDVRIAMIRQNYSDKAYETLKKEYSKNQHIIDEYKKLIDMGFLDLTKINNDSPPSRMKMSRTAIKTKDLDGLAIKSCNGNIDTISQDQLDDDEYPLSKLQLISKIHTRNKKNEIIRTDCFYAPDLYNYIAINRVANKPVVNPQTRVEIDEKDIEKLMKIINFIEPGRPYPGMSHNIKDEFLKLEYKEVTFNENSSHPSGRDSFYELTVIRDFEVTEINVLEQVICYIPVGITVQDTESADLSSEIVLFNMFKLFNSGKLLINYLPPYHDNKNNNRKTNKDINQARIRYEDWMSPSWFASYPPSTQAIRDTMERQIKVLRKMNEIILGVL